MPDPIIKHPFVLNLRLELRKLRQEKSRLERSLNSHKEKNEKLEGEVIDLEKKKRELEENNKDLKKEKEQLENELNLLKGTNEKNAENATTFKLMIFGRKDRPTTRPKPACS